MNKTINKQRSSLASTLNHPALLSFLKSPLKGKCPIGLIIVITILSYQSKAQVTTYANGAAEGSALLDVKSTDKGVLIPRMTTIQRNNIINPEKGLLVFDNDYSIFYFFNGVNWVEMGALSRVFTIDSVKKVVLVDSNSVDLAKDDFVFGATQLDDTGNSDHDQRFFFDKSKGAFRAGDVKYDTWDDANVGDFSVAFGKDTQASGKAAFALGRNAFALGDYSFAAGDGVVAKENFTIAMGDEAFANSFGSVAIGNQVDANGFGSIALGYYNTASSDLETVLGFFSTDYTPSLLDYTSNRLFTIGNGLDKDNRSDAFMILKNGNTFINGVLTLNNAFSFPTTDGTNGQFLSTDGSGALTWTSNENQDLTISGGILSLTGDTTTVDLNPYLVGDHLGNHYATKNIRLNGNYLSGDGNNEGIKVGAGGNVSTSGKLSVGTTVPNAKFHVVEHFSQAGKFVAIIENSNGGDYANGLQIKSGQNVQAVNNRFISFARPDGTEIGAVRQTSSWGVDFWSLSDRRLKTNIMATNYGLEDLLKINVVNYHFKSDTTQRHTGFIAQDLYKHYPEAVIVGSDDVKSDPWMVNHGRITPLLVKAVQDQQLQIDGLKLENKVLKKELEKIDELEALLLKMQVQVETNNAILTSIEK